MAAVAADAEAVARRSRGRLGRDRPADRPARSTGSSPTPRSTPAPAGRRLRVPPPGLPRPRRRDPAADRAAAFLESSDPDKRARLIDELLAGPRFGRHMAETLGDPADGPRLDQPAAQGRAAGRLAGRAVQRNTPGTRSVRDLLTATGTQEENGATTFFIALRTPDKLNDQVCRLFLGVQLQCAQCHDHPFTPWKRDDYWSMAAFFSKVRAGGKKVGMAKNGVESVNEDGQGQEGPAARLGPRPSPEVPRRRRARARVGRALPPGPGEVADPPENPFFARAMVNRTWAQFFGRGLVNPVDNINDYASRQPPRAVRGAHPAIRRRRASTSRR